MLNLFKKEQRNETLVQIDKEARRRKVEKIKNDVVEAANKAVDWCVEHPVEAVGIAVTVGSALYKGGRLITRNREIRHEQYIADCRFYDPRIGEYVFSDRKLSNDEKLRFNRLYSEGMSKREALNIMGRIKQ